MSYLVKAIKKLKPNAEFTFTDQDYSTIEWIVLEGKAPTKTEIDAAIKDVETEEQAQIAKMEAEKTALLAKLGITADEAKLLLQ